jgi:hypothetical protein
MSENIVTQTVNQVDRAALVRQAILARIPHSRMDDR